jgi:hypothetical protein
MLKYLFTAEYKDGSLYQQNADDKSVKEPDKRSCYFDVDQDNLVGFVLRGKDHTYGVDLRDGHFEVDGVPFFMKESNKGIMFHLEELPNGKPVAIPLQNLRLIYWRRHTHDIQTNIKTEEQKETDHQVVFKLGWQCEVKCTNKDCWAFKKGLTHNYQEIMQIE